MREGGAMRDARLEKCGKRTGSGSNQKEIPMRMQILAVAGALMLSMVAAGECKAQSKALMAHIPFAFEAGDKTMPAGNYRIEFMPTGAGSLQVIRSVEGDAKATISTIVEAAPDATSGPGLVFHRYGSQYFLAQIQTGDGHARQVFPSRQEKEMAHSQSRTEVALVARAAAAKQ
jgi:hypothetical protein